MLAAGFAAAWPGVTGYGNNNANGWTNTEWQAMRHMMQGQLLPGDIPALNSVMGQWANETGTESNEYRFPCWGGFGQYPQNANGFLTNPGYYGGMMRGKINNPYR